MALPTNAWLCGRCWVKEVAAQFLDEEHRHALLKESD